MAKNLVRYLAEEGSTLSSINALFCCFSKSNPPPPHTHTHTHTHTQTRTTNQKDE